MKELNNSDLKSIINKKYEYWKNYYEVFSKRGTDISSRRKEIVEKLSKDKYSEDSLKDVEYLFYDYNMCLKDLEYYTTELSVLIGLLPEEDRLDYDLITYKKFEPIFVLDNDKLVERIKGKKDEYISKIRSSKQYTNMVELLKKQIQ